MRFTRLLSALALLAAGIASAQPTQRPLIITFADVGQGDAALITTPEGKHILIDAGPSAEAAQRMFSKSVPDTLDLVIASHNHSDHIGGMPWVFQRFVVRAYMENGVPHTTSVYRHTMAAVERERGLQYLQATARAIKVGSVTLRVLPPLRADATQNDNSIGILVEYGAFRALLTGDSERMELAQWMAHNRAARVQVLKAAHHGARNGVTPDWIRITRPKVVVISLSAVNDYGRPDPAVVRAWRASGATVYRTDLDGSVTVAAKLDGSFQTFAAKRDIKSAPVRPR